MKEDLIKWEKGVSFDIPSLAKAFGYDFKSFEAGIKIAVEFEKYASNSKGGYTNKSTIKEIIEKYGEFLADKENCYTLEELKSLLI